MFGSFFEYSDLKQSRFLFFSDLVLNRKKGKRNKQIIGILFESVYGSFFEHSDLKPNRKKQLTVSFWFFWFGFESEKGQKQ